MALLLENTAAKLMKKLQYRFIFFSALHFPIYLPIIYSLKGRIQIFHIYVKYLSYICVIIIKP